MTAHDSQKPPDPEVKTKRKNLDHRTEKKFREGRMAIEGTLDMHGLTQDNAFSVMREFIIDAYHNDKRCLLIVTGKGRRHGAVQHWTDEKPGVLKEKFPLWLEDPTIDPLVLSFCPAKPRHGGAGAFYILLRRRRP